MAAFARPQTLDEALRLLASDRWCILAGATDLYPLDALRRSRGETRLGCEANILDISGIAALQQIRRESDRVVIGAAVTWRAIAEAELPSWCHALVQAAHEVGGRQIQNRGTIGGNLCNASPAADGIPPLLALDAEVELAAPSGRRRLSIAAFVVGNRRTARKLDEVLVAIHLPEPPVGTRSVFFKLGARRHLVISIVALSAALRLDRAGRLVDPRFAVGACAPTAVRLASLEEELAGLAVPAALGRISAERLVELRPIDDVRASATYRLEATAELLRRAILSLARDERPAGGLIR